MDEELDESQSQEDGTQGSPDNTEDDPLEIDGYVPEDDPEGDPEEGEGDNTPPPTEDAEPLTIEDIAPLVGAGITKEQVEDLATQWGVTPQLMAQTLGLVSQSVSREVRTHTVGNAILRQQIDACPGTEKMAAKFEAMLSEVSPEHRTNKGTVILAMANTYIKELKPGETWAHFIRRAAADIGLARQTTIPSQKTAPQQPRATTPKPKLSPAPQTPPRASNGPSRQETSFAMKLLRKQYGGSNANWDAIEQEVSRGVRP